MSNLPRDIPGGDQQCQVVAPVAAATLNLDTPYLRAQNSGPVYPQNVNVIHASIKPASHDES
jgi:hypothetical protein